VKKLLCLLVAGLFVASSAFAGGSCGASDKKDGGNDPIKDVVTLPVKTVQAVGDVVTGQAGSKEEAKK
jgi:hypothetical protein